MKQLFLSVIFLVIGTASYAVPNNFKDGDIVSAEKMNENFQHLEQQFQGALAKTVNCAAGEKISDAISNGYTNITVSGTCTENLLYTVWRDVGVDNQPSEKLAPGYLKITGADSTAKIVDATSNAKATISVNSGVTLVLENITVSGGIYGVNAVRNANLLMTGGVTIENFSERGIRVDDSSYLGVDDGGVTITGGDGAERGIFIGTGSSGWIHTSTISNVKEGMGFFGGSHVYLYNFTIEASQKGINFGDHSTAVRYEDGTGLIEGTSDRAIDAWQGNFYSWSPGSLTIQKLKGGRGISIGRGGKSSITNLKMPDFNSVGSGWNPAITVDKHSYLELENAEISGSTDRTLVRISDGSFLELRNSNITAGSVGNGIFVGENSNFNFYSSTITGTAETLVTIDQGSSAKFEDSTLTTNGGGRGLGINGSSLNFYNSTVTGTVTGNLVEITEGSNAKLEDSTLTGTVNDNLVNITEGSNASILRSTLTVTTSDTWGSGIRLSESSELQLRESTIEASHRGMAVQRNSYAEMRNGSSVTGSANHGVTVYGGAGLKVNSGSTVVSTGASAINISQSSWTEIDGGDGSTINRTDDGDDISVSTMSLLSIEGGNSIGEVSCSSKGYVNASEGSVMTLPDSCTE